MKKLVDPYLAVVHEKVFSKLCIDYSGLRFFSRPFDKHSKIDRFKLSNKRNLAHCT